MPAFADARKKKQGAGKPKALSHFDPSQPRGGDGRWISSGLTAVSTPAPNVGAINKALGVDMPPGGGWMPPKVHSKIKDKRPQEYNFTMENIGAALRRPDYVGFDASNPAHINLVKMTPNTSWDALLVSIDGTRTRQGNYPVLTAHSIKISQIEARTAAGRLKKV